MYTGRVLSTSDSLGVALVDTEIVGLAGGRIGKFCLIDETLGVVAFLGAVVAAAVGAWVRVFRAW